MLSNGENVEPQPLEDLLCTSPHIQSAGRWAGSADMTLPFWPPQLLVVKMAARLSRPAPPPAGLRRMQCCWGRATAAWGRCWCHRQKPWSRQAAMSTAAPCGSLSRQEPGRQCRLLTAANCVDTVPAAPCQATAALCTHLLVCPPPAWLQGEVARVLAGRPPHEHVRAFAVLEAPFAIEDGTLTRTMKPRKQAIFAKYAEQVAQVERQLR